MLTRYIERKDTATMLTNYIERKDTSGMLTRYIERKDTAAMLLQYTRFAEVQSLIGDSIAARMAGATTGIALLDSTGNAQGNYMPRKQTADLIHDSIVGFSAAFDTTYLYQVIDSLKDRTTSLEDQVTTILNAISYLDITPPHFLSAELGDFADDTLLVLFDTTDVRQDSIPSVLGFNLTADGTHVKLDTAKIGHDSLFLKLDAPGATGLTYLLNYTSANATKNSKKRLQDSTGNKVVNWVNKAVTNNFAPLVSSISVWGTGGATTITDDDGTLQMLKKTLPINAGDTTATWSVVPGTGTANISGTGLLTALTDGTINARATANDGSAVYGQKQITLSNQINLDADVATYISGLSTPLSSGQKTLINNFVVGLKSDLSITNLSDMFDVMYILAGETAESSLRNLVERHHDATVVSAMAWTALEGYTGDGVADYLDTHYNPATEGVNFAQNDASIGMYNRLNVVSQISSWDDVATPSANQSTIHCIANHNDSYSRFNNTINDYRTCTTTDIRGLFVINRTGNLYTNNVIYLNKTAPTMSGEGTSNTITPPSLNLYIAAEDKASTGADSFQSQQTSFVFIGKHITTAQRDYIVDRIEAYMDANGKGVL
jgi:hypothetical protein